MNIFVKDDANSRETENRIKKTVVQCFSQVLNVPEFGIKEDTDFFEFSTDVSDYFVLLLKIKNSFGFYISDYLIAGQRTVGGFTKQICAASKRYIKSGSVLKVSNRLGKIFLYKKEPSFSLFHVKIAQDAGFAYIGKACRLLEKGLSVALSCNKDLLGVIYIAIQTNSPICLSEKHEPIDIKAYYDRGFSEKTNLRNIENMLKERL